MTIKTKFSISSRVCWYSDDCGRVLTGTVTSVHTESYADGSDVSYWVAGDAVIKQSVDHYLQEEDLWPISRLQELTEKYRAHIERLECNYEVLVQGPDATIYMVRRLSDDTTFEAGERTLSGLIDRFEISEGASGGLLAKMHSGSSVAINSIAKQTQ